MQIPVLTIMFLIMFTLKLAGPMAAVSWWVITAPLWVPLLIVVLLFLAALLFARN